MKFSILKIVLWPKRVSFLPREVIFLPGKLNVITGASQTGKSALIPIVDYCLGAGKCAIPVGTIRDTVEWFGVLVETERGQVLLARREPGLRQATDEMFMLEGKSLELPKRIEKSNANRAFVKHYLDEISGLTSLDVTVAANSAYKGRPSFRDMAAFTFQPQNIVANPDVLFFKADTNEHREKLKNVLPYALGVTTAEVLAKRAELDELRREYRSTSRELNSLRDGAHRWVTELRINLSKAREFGLLAEDTEINLPEQTAIAVIRRLVTASSTREGRSSLDVARPSVLTLSDEISRLQQLEQDQAMELSQLRKRLLEMTRLREAAAAYSEAIAVEEERLGISRWLSQKAESEDAPCPICGNELLDPKGHLAHLVRELEEVERGSAQFRTLPPSFDKEWADVRTKIKFVTDSLVGTQRQLSAIQQFNDEERSRRYTELNASRFLGVLSSELGQYDRFVSDDEIATRLENLSIKIAELAEEVDENALREKLKRILGQLSGYTNRLLPRFGVESPNDPASLSITELTLKISRKDRVDWLVEVGSGSNWLGYHLSLMLAMHEYFLAEKASPVPSFLMIDQPSQVYFPKKLAGKLAPKDLDPKLADDDTDRVRALFRELSAITTEAKSALQLIVVDHAGRNIWGNLPEINFVEEWRGAKKLIPLAWEKAFAVGAGSN
jgi:hypothetical protein